jgi:sterol 3beta-glucosyltransferase
MDGKVPDDTIEDSEESWTFIGDDTDPELIKRMQDWEGIPHSGAYGGGSRVNSGSSTLGNRALSSVAGVAASR